MKKYMYVGPVEEFGKCVCPWWCGTTVAQSLVKAKSNLMFRYKKENGKASNSRINLPGKIKECI